MCVCGHYCESGSLPCRVCGFAQCAPLVVLAGRSLWERLALVGAECTAWAGSAQCASLVVLAGRSFWERLALVGAECTAWACVCVCVVRYSEGGWGLHGPCWSSDGPVPAERKILLWLCPTCILLLAGGPSALRLWLCNPHCACKDLVVPRRRWPGCLKTLVPVEATWDPSGCYKGPMTA